MTEELNRIDIPDKIRPLLESIKLPKGCYIAGGAIYNYFIDEDYETPDIDVFGNKDKINEFLELNNLQATLLPSGNYSCGMMFNKRISYNCTRPVCSISELLSEFDFNHCRMLYDGSDKLYVYPNAVRHSKRKILADINVTPCTAYNTLNRTFRFLDRGFLLPLDERHVLIEGIKKAEGTEQLIYSSMND